MAQSESPFCCFAYKKSVSSGQVFSCVNYPWLIWSVVLQCYSWESELANKAVQECYYGNKDADLLHIRHKICPHSSAKKKSFAKKKKPWEGSLEKCWGSLYVSLKDKCLLLWICTGLYPTTPFSQGRKRSQDTSLPCEKGTPSSSEWLLAAVRDQINKGMLPGPTIHLHSNTYGDKPGLKHQDQ